MTPAPRVAASPVSGRLPSSTVPRPMKMKLRTARTTGFFTVASESGFGLSRCWAETVTEASRRRRLLEVRRGEVPVHEVREPGLDVLRAQVAVVDVVRVLPDVAREQAGG